jgi:hypothetical protein
MKIIITENQLKKLVLESDTPCPSNKEEDKIITVSDLKNGEKISLGYCNGSSKSAIVFVQKKLKEMGYLKWNGDLGYFGKLTLNSLCKFLRYEECEESIKIGKKTIEKLENEEDSPRSLFDELNETEKVLVCTLIGEAGGEDNPYEGMQAVANVLNNRAEINHEKRGNTPYKQALNPSQYSMWNSYNSGKKKIEDIYKLYEDHDEMENAIKIVNSINSIKDITEGSTHYYNSNKTDGFPKNWEKEVPYNKKTKLVWKKIKKIGKHIFGKYILKSK